MDGDDMRRSENVDDRRGMRSVGGPVGLGFGGLLMVLLISWIAGVNPRRLGTSQYGSTLQGVLWHKSPMKTPPLLCAIRSK